MDIHKAFRKGAEAIASQTYQQIHQNHGIAQIDWELLTQSESWTPQESRAIRAILAQVIEVSLTVAGMPPAPLPAQYAAACIAIVVAPANRLTAAMKCPDTFDAVQASGLRQTVAIETASREQMMSLVLAYSGGLGGEPMPRLPAEVGEAMKLEDAQ